MPTVTYNVYEEEKGYQPKVTVNECGQTSGKMPTESFEKKSGKREIIGIVFCCFVAVGIVAISALHFESQRRWDREHTDLEEKYHRLEENRILLEENTMNETLQLRNFIEMIKREAHNDTLQWRNQTELMKIEARTEALQLRGYVEQVKREARDDTLQLRNDTELIKNEVRAERDKTALAIKSMNESIRFRILELNADISVAVLSQDNQNSYINLILVKLLGWEKSEYVVYKYFRQAVNYGTARSRCAGYLGGRLAATTLRDPKVVSNIISKGYTGTFHSRISKPWIGFDDSSTEGTWRWSDGGEMNLETTVWSPNQPDDSNGEDCGHIWYADQGKLQLNDDECDSANYYICEVDK